MYKKLTLFTVLFVLIDQVSKNIVNLCMNVNDSINILGKLFNITYVHNYGAAFSMFGGARYLFIIVTILVLNIIYLFFIRNKSLSNYQIVIYSMLLGGIIGNLIDRVMYGYVLDFIDIRLFDFAIFNIADSLIVISVILLIAQEVFHARNSSGRK